MGGERFILAVKLGNGYKPQQSVCVLGPREANCLFVLRVYGLSAAQLTGNLKLKEAAHQWPLSAFWAHTPDKARQRGSWHSQPMEVPAVLWGAPGMQREEGLETMNSPALSSPPSWALCHGEDIAAGCTRKKVMGFSCSTAPKREKIVLKVMCECHQLWNSLEVSLQWFPSPIRFLGAGVSFIIQWF